MEYPCSEECGALLHSEDAGSLLRGFSCPEKGGSPRQAVCPFMCSLCLCTLLPERAESPSTRPSSTSAPSSAH